jgi:hypothetical protein
MKHIAHINEENKWRNIAIGTLLLFTSCKDDIHITDKKGSPVSIEKYKGKNIEATIVEDNISSEKTKNIHEIKVKDFNGNQIEFEEVEYMGVKYKKGDTLSLEFDDNGDVKALIMKNEDNPLFKYPGK